MGIDTRIFFKANDDFQGLCWSETVFTDLIDRAYPHPEGATHEVEPGCRYYASDNPRGPWPFLAHILMELLADPGVDTVWYGADLYDDDMLPKCTPGTVLEYSAYYMMDIDA